MKTEPIPPDPNAFGIIASISALGMMVVSMRRHDGWLYTVFIGLMIAIGFFILYVTAHRKYKTALELWRLFRRAGGTQELPEAGNIYNIDGTVSMRAADGSWLDIGEGSGTFQILPRPVLMPRDPVKYEGRDLTPAQRGQLSRQKQTPPAVAD